MDSRREEPKNNPAEEEGGPEVWEALNRNFKQVQSVLDKNRALIQQVNENHRSKIADNMVKNVALIREINVNISKVASLYSDLSSDFSSMFHQRNENTPDNNKEEEGSSNNRLFEKKPELPCLISQPGEALAAVFFI
ncbi:hypothetical protein HS088_TW13G01353 [Tripterygium wilfordii]|uniref:Protein EARLY FLOWERING 4 domain-containing protein n=1 Tax=Tripterygium wilfordii TaxID=458696 RepID=A0A7J7CWQ6_TRIWF|nr:hypothetical protein HS088_TW13G01353 [Tripterygium wilfordii]